MKLQIQDNIAQYKGRKKTTDASRDMRIVRSFELFTGENISSILDVGARETGFLRLFPKGVKKYGIDLFRPADAAQGSEIVFKIADAEERIPFRDGFFDAIFAGEIIEHLYDTDAFLQECSRVLKPGGTIVISTPNLCSLNNLLSIIFQKQLFSVAYGRRSGVHLRYYCVSSIKQQLGVHDFHVEKLIGNRIYLPFWIRSGLMSRFTN